MKRLIKITLPILLLVVAAAGIFVAVHEPARRPVTDLVIERTPERLECGEYLVHHVVGCVHCHTERDATQRLLPASGPAGAGGDCFTEEAGLPGRIYPQNITSDRETGIAAWADDEILRAIREGVSRDGRALFPIMPYEEYRHLADEDAHAIVAYIRTLEPVKKRVEPTHINFPVSFFIEMSPQPLTASVAAVPHSDPLKYGEYLTSISGCKSCHGPDLSGDMEFVTPKGAVRSSNLTPSSDLVPADAEAFIRLFGAYANGRLPEGVSNNDFTGMPRAAYAGMSGQDLRAIHAYLRSVPPVDNEVQTYSEATGD